MYLPHGFFQLPSSRSTAGDGRHCRFKEAMTIGNAVRTVKSHLGVDNLMIALARGSTMGKKNVHIYRYARKNGTFTFYSCT